MLHHQFKYFERIHIKRDYINNVGNLICFPIPSTVSGLEDKILVVGGLNIGLLSSKSHVYDAIGQKVNYHGDL